jgi:FlaA1/EpsC-like NDP-sugar epimerase
VSAHTEPHGGEGGPRGLLGLRPANALRLLALDGATVLIAVCLAYLLRFDGNVPEGFARYLPLLLAAAEAVYLGLLASGGLYAHVWRHAGVGAYIATAAYVALGTIAIVLADVVFPWPGGARMIPIGVMVMTGVLTLGGALTWRSAPRVVAYLESRRRHHGAMRALIVGAGSAGLLLLREIESQPDLGLDVVGFVDDDMEKIGRGIGSVRVLGGVDQIARIISEDRVDEVFVAVPSATDLERRKILESCAAAGVRTRTVASPLAHVVRLRLNDLTDVRVEDLLGREPVLVDTRSIEDMLRDQVVAITGAAGTIGRELARQVLAADPLRVLLIDIDESRLYETFLELSAISASVPVMCLHDIREERRLTTLFNREKPTIVLHAAAYKHVPMMELVPDQAIVTNVGGTLNVVEASLACGVEHFVLISTDKAVEPRNMMGLTKYIAELVALDGARRGLNACAVRFGNVLGSRGSVVPIFEEHLRRGGPLKVTHADATRYFMTIPEAAKLVLKAGSMSVGGDIFVLDMGEPVRILDLARKMIALTDPRVIIEFVGLRPGEKLHEVLAYSTETLKPTSAEKVLKLEMFRRPADDFGVGIGALVEAARDGDYRTVRDLLVETVPAATWVRSHEGLRD